MNEQAQPTPGPWIAEIVHSGEPGWRIVSDAKGYPNDGWMICGSIMGPDSDANARLIAAVPRLLAAAKAVCRFDWSDNDDDAVTTIEDLRTAIAEVEGHHGDL